MLFFKLLVSHRIKMEVWNFRVKYFWYRERAEKVSLVTWHARAGNVLFYDKTLVASRSETDRMNFMSALFVFCVRTFYYYFLYLETCLIICFSYFILYRYIGITSGRPLLCPRVYRFFTNTAGTMNFSR